MANGSKPQIDRVQYWRTQIQRTVILLVVWFTVGFLLSVFLARPLNDINFGGIPFGFWMAQQGAIFVFISLVLIYAVMSGRLDEEAGVAESEDMMTPPSEAH
jgi:putative solute:sodium symporter small subunit